ncbi:MAG: T9SS type A sorting domain-containing protein [bacterium]
MARKLFMMLAFMFMVTGAMIAQNTFSLVWKLHELPFQDPGVGSEMALVKAGFDTDKDGKGEFLCAYTDLDSNFLMMYEANGDNTYDLVWYFKYPIAANSFAGVVVGDLDNNGKDEIITTMPSIANPETPNPPRVWVFEWNGVVGENDYGNYTTGTMEANSEWNFDVPDNIDFRPYSLIIEDIDGDDRNELLVGVRAGGRGDEVMVVSLEGEFTGFSTWIIEYNLQNLTGGGMYNVTTGDLDKDGKKEIYAFVWNLFTLHIIESTGADQYQLVNSLEELFAAENIDYGTLEGVRVADVDNDGVNEMYIACTEPDNALFVITNITDVSAITKADIKALAHLPRTNVGKLRTLNITDIDHDGKMDLMIGGEGNGKIFDYEYNGSGDVTDSTNWTLNIAFDVFEYSGIAPDAVPTITPRFFYGSCATDMDGDGKSEYVFVNYSCDFEIWSEDCYVFMIESDKGVGVEDDLVMPNSNYLAQNYPNPFNPSTTISFNVLKSDNVKLVVFDMLGREVATLVNNVLPAGQQSYSFDASKLTSGVYMYQLTVGTWMQTKKMTLVK